MCSKTEEDDTVLLGLVQGSKLLLELGLGNVGAGWMEDIEDELAAGEKAVGDEFASTQSDRCRVISLEDLSEDQRTSGLLQGHPTLSNRDLPQNLAMWLLRVPRMHTHHDLNYGSAFCDVFLPDVLTGSCEPVEE